MEIIEYLKKLFEGRGFFAPFLVIAGWTYVGIIVCVFMGNIFLLVFRIKYYDDEFKRKVIKEAIDAGDASSVASNYNINPELMEQWVKKAKKH